MLATDQDLEALRTLPAAPLFDRLEAAIYTAVDRFNALQSRNDPEAHYEIEVARFDRSPESFAALEVLSLKGGAYVVETETHGHTAQGDMRMNEVTILLDMSNAVTVDCADVTIIRDGVHFFNEFKPVLDACLRAIQLGECARAVE